MSVSFVDKHSSCKEYFTIIIIFREIGLALSVVLSLIKPEPDVSYV